MHPYARWCLFRKECIQLQTYTYIRYLGQGSFGDIWNVKNTKDKLRVLKSSIKREEILQEISIYKTLQRCLQKNNTIRHPHLLYFYRAFYAIIQKQRVYFIELEYCPKGALENYVLQIRRGTLTLSAVTIRSILGQLSMALSILHKHDIIHRDLTPHNILCALETSCDFPFCLLLESSQKSKSFSDPNTSSKESKNENNICLKLSDFGVSSTLKGRSATIHAAGTPTYVI